MLRSEALKSVLLAAIPPLLGIACAGCGGSPSSPIPSNGSAGSSNDGTPSSGDPAGSPSQNATNDLGNGSTSSSPSQAPQESAAHRRVSCLGRHYLGTT